MKKLKTQAKSWKNSSQNSKKTQKPATPVELNWRKIVQKKKACIIALPAFWHIFSVVMNFWITGPECYLSITPSYLLWLIDVDGGFDCIADVADILKCLGSDDTKCSCSRRHSRWGEGWLKQGNWTGHRIECKKGDNFFYKTGNWGFLWKNNVTLVVEFKIPPKTKICHLKCKQRALKNV